MNFIKNMRLITLVLLLLVSIFFLIKPMFTKTFGTIVLSVEKDSKCSLHEGDAITQVSGTVVSNSADFRGAEKTIKENEYITMVINNGPGGCVAARDGYFGVNVADIPSKYLRFGIDIQGGVVNVFRPSRSLTTNQLNRVIDIINKRIKVVNLPEAWAYSSDGVINIVGLSSERMGMLIMPGDFEARISKEIKLENDAGELGIGNNSYPVKRVSSTSLSINNSFYETNQSFSLEDVKFYLINITNNSAAVEATIFTNDDVKQFLTAYGYVKYDSNYQAYEFNVPLEISNEASDKFVKITKKLSTIYVMGKPTLEGNLIYYLDGDVINKLTIPFEMMGKKIDNIAVVGFRRTMTEALNEKLRIEVAASGKLPAELKMTDTKFFEPTLKEMILWSMVLTIATVALSVNVLSYLRYKNIKFGLLMILLIMAEAVCVLGAAALIQAFYGYGWILDSASIVGLIALIVSSGIQMFFLTERVIKKKDFGLFLKYKKILNTLTFLNIVIFFVAFSMLFVWKGFGLSLIVGFAVGFLITKPLYDEILRKHSTAAVS